VNNSVNATRDAAAAAMHAVRSLYDSLRDSASVPGTLDGHRQIIERLCLVTDALAALYPALGSVLQQHPGFEVIRPAASKAARHLRAASGHAARARAAADSSVVLLRRKGSAHSSNYPDPAGCPVITAADGARDALQRLGRELAAEARGTRRSADAAIDETEQCLYQAACDADDIFLIEAQLVVDAYQAAGIIGSASPAERPLQDAAMAVRAAYCATRRARVVLEENASAAARRSRASS
jgi:hypothetical protein